MLTINGRIRIARIRWHGDTVGSCTILDGYLDRAERTISVGGGRWPVGSTAADQKYKEFKLVTYDDEDVRHRLVLGTRSNCDEAGRLMQRLATRIDLGSATEKVGNVDGAAWIRNQVEGRALPLDALGLDFYHLSEQVHKARLGGGGAACVQARRVRAGVGAVGDVAAGLPPTPRAAADVLLNYVSDRRTMIRYPEFLAKGWQIGSGPTESCCKTLTQRLKGSGMRWDADNAEAVMALEALRKSDRWQTDWRTLLPATT